MSARAIGKAIVTLSLIAVLFAVIRHDYAKVKERLGPDLRRMFKKVDPERVKVTAAMTSLDTYRPDSFDILFKIDDVPQEGRTVALREHVDYYEKIIRYRPNQMEAYAMLGFCYYQEGKTDAAIQSYQRAIQLAPSFFWSSYNLGAIYFNQRDYVMAAKYFKRALQLDARETLQTVLRSRVFLEILSRAKVRADDVQTRLTGAYQKAYEALLLCEYYRQQVAEKNAPIFPVRFY